ncbi:MAG TPA: exodeoxyribonuclease III [Acetobacteraceae bacterium]|jgi:exodeoxyribonuclease-3|nr:exodeoxyribonuclease III [Acetobacteraceae bacterium]
MKIATWNVNSIRQREKHVADWLARLQPDLLLLQETKCEAQQFPAETYEKLGYRSEVVGQKAYNGVAVLSRGPVEVTQRCLPGLDCDDNQARYLEVRAEGLTVGNLYLPNGNSGGPAGFAYKLRWMDCLAARAQALLEADEPFLFAGDYNVCPADDDFAPGSLPAEDALIRPETRAAFRKMLWLGLTDAVRAVQPWGKAYTFWDYQAGAWRKDMGLRIDHALLSPELAERLLSAKPDRDERNQPQPSDHVPVVVELAAPA